MAVADLVHDLVTIGEWLEVAVFESDTVVVPEPVRVLENVDCDAVAIVRVPERELVGESVVRLTVGTDRDDVSVLVRDIHVDVSLWLGVALAEVVTEGDVVLVPESLRV